jgi:hypothetical protein
MFTTCFARSAAPNDDSLRALVLQMVLHDRHGLVFVNMVKTVNRPLATRSIVVGRKRFRKTQLDNVMDGVGAIYGLIFFAAIAGVLWLS